MMILFYARFLHKFLANERSRRRRIDTTPNAEECGGGFP